jgi:hypothetical protein
VAGRHLAVGHQPLDLGRQLEEAEEVGHGRAALPDPLGDRLLGHVEVLDQLLVGRRLLQRVEIVAVQVLDQRVLQRQLVADVAHEDGDVLQPRPLGRPPASLPGDEGVAIGPELADEDRLQDAELADRRGEPGQRLLVEAGPGLEGVGLDLGDRHLLHPGGRTGASGDVGRDEGAEALTQPAAPLHRSPPGPGSGRRSTRERSGRT